MRYRYVASIDFPMVWYGTCFFKITARRDFIKGIEDLEDYILYEDTHLKSEAIEKQDNHFLAVLKSYRAIYGRKYWRGFRIKIERDEDE